MYNKLEHITIVCSWRKLLDHSRNELPMIKEGAEDTKIVELMNMIPGCKEPSDAEVEEWM